VKKKQKARKPTKPKRAPHRAPAPQASPDEEKSAREREAETARGTAALEHEGEELPDSDEETKVVLLPVNPYLVHVYWGIAANDREELERAFRRPGPRAQPVLRFYNITQVNLDATIAPSWFDVEINLRAGNWYVHLDSPARSYCIDLGLRTAGGAFHRLARSNVAETPRASPSEKVEESYLRVEADSPRVETVVAAVEPTDFVGVPPQAPDDGEQQGGKDKRPEAKELRIFRTVAPGEIERKLAELYRLQGWESPRWAPKGSSAGEPRPSGKERADLTELSEKSFRAGISSGQK
jgi:hypothetical protein